MSNQLQIKLILCITKKNSQFSCANGILLPTKQDAEFYFVTREITFVICFVSHNVIFVCHRFFHTIACVFAEKKMSVLICHENDNLWSWFCCWWFWFCRWGNVLLLDWIWMHTVSRHNIDHNFDLSDTKYELFSACWCEIQKLFYCSPIPVHWMLIDSRMFEIGRLEWLLYIILFGYTCTVLFWKHTSWFWVLDEVVATCYGRKLKIVVNFS